MVTDAEMYDQTEHPQNFNLQVATIVQPTHENSTNKYKKDINATDPSICCISHQIRHSLYRTVHTHAMVDEDSFVM